VDWENGTVSFTRKKTNVPVLIHLGEEALNLFKDPPAVLGAEVRHVGLGTADVPAFAVNVRSNPDGDALASGLMHALYLQSAYISSGFF
jgi:hypothetical protein